MKSPSSEEDANDEILLVMNKPKHPNKKKGEYKEQKWKDPQPRRQKNHLQG
jgi:hypothetical protein